jgi:hypothetical protein
MILAAPFPFLLFGFHPSHKYVLYVFLMMIIVLEPCYEVMNHYVLSRQLSFLPTLCTFLHIAYILSLS